MNNIFLFLVKNRERIITTFKLIYLSCILFTMVAAWSFLTHHPSEQFFYSIATTFGQAGLILYVLTLIPGIVRRFGKNYKSVSLLMIFRRYLGLTMFFCVVYHYMAMRGVTVLTTGKLFENILLFEGMGMIAFFGLFLLAVTSNDVSTNKLGVWWGRIHGTTYGIVWFIFLHTALQKMSIWSLLIGGIGVVQVLSFVYRFSRR